MIKASLSEELGRAPDLRPDLLRRTTMRNTQTASVDKSHYGVTKTKTFDQLLILRHYRVPIGAMSRVLGHGRALIEEHLALADKHFPTEERLQAYLKGRGIELESTG